MKAYIVRGGALLSCSSPKQAEVGDFYTWGRNPKMVSKCVTGASMMYGIKMHPTFKAATPEEAQHVLNIIKTHELLFK